MERSTLKAAIRKLVADLQQSLATTIANRPDKTYADIAREYGVSEATVLNAAREHGLSRKPGPKKVVRHDSI